MKMKSCIGKDIMCVSGKLLSVIIVLGVFCYMMSCRVNHAITKGVTDEVQVTIPIPQSSTDSVSQARFEEALRQLQNENRERISNCIEAINGNLTLWMSLICAVCTLLPIASNLYYSYQMGEVEREFNESIEEQQKQLNQEIAVLHIIQMSSILTLLCEMQQLFRHHNVFLTGEKELEQALVALKRYVQDIRNLPDEEGTNVNHQFSRDLCFFLLCKFELLFNTYESIFGYPHLMELLALKDKVYDAKKCYGNESTKPSELKQMVITITDQLIHLFKEVIKARKKDQSGQS